MPIKTTLLPLMTCSALWLAGCGDSSTDPADLPEGTPPADATSTDSDAASLIDNATKEAKQTADQVVDQANRAAEDATDAVNNAVEQSEQAVDDVKQQANDAVEEVNRSVEDAQKSVADALKPKQNSQDGQGDLGGLLNNRGGFGLPGQTRQAEEDADEDADERTTVRGVSFVMPEGWRVGPPKTMRLLTLLPPQDFNDADLAVSKWPGDVGGFAANVTRWARQAGTTPKSLKRADYPQITVDGKDAAWIKLVGEGGGNAILAVWVPRGENLDRPTETWTFKLTCKADQVDKLEAAVKAWAESVKFE